MDQFFNSQFIVAFFDDKQLLPSSLIAAPRPRRDTTVLQSVCCLVYPIGVG